MREVLSRAGNEIIRALRTLLVTLLLLVLVAGTSYAIATWQVAQERLERVQEIDRLRAELTTKLEQVTALAASSGEVLGPVTAQPEGPAVGSDYAAFKEETEQRLSSLETSIREGLGRNNEEEQRLTLSLQLKTLLLKAKAEVLEVKLNLAEDNRGEARRELELAGSTVAQAAKVAPEEVRKELEQVIELIDQARSDLLLGSPTGPDRVALLWHRLGLLVGDFESAGQ